MSNALKVPQASTLDRLLLAADEELREAGVEALTIRGVAARAGTSTATAYNYLSSRNHLFAELFHREVLLAHPPQIAGRTPRDRVVSVTTHLAAVLRDRPHLAAAANHALLGTDTDVERLRVAIGAELVRRFDGRWATRRRRGARRAAARPHRRAAADRHGADLVRRPAGPPRRGRDHDPARQRMTLRRSPSTPTTTASRRTPTRSTPGCASTSRCTTTPRSTSGRSAATRTSPRRCAPRAPSPTPTAWPSRRPPGAPTRTG